MSLIFSQKGLKCHKKLSHATRSVFQVFLTGFAEKQIENVIY